MPKLETLEDLFVKELRDVYHAEKQITKALKRMVKSASSDDLRGAFERHLEETNHQIERLEQAFESIDQRPRAQHCAGMAGIIEEGEDLLGEAKGAVSDAGLLASAQKVEHYEIAAYGTLEAYARLLGHEEAAELLNETLEEEKATDQLLTELAENSINPGASAGAEEPVQASGSSSRRG